MLSNLAFVSPEMWILQADPERCQIRMMRDYSCEESKRHTCGFHAGGCVDSVTK